MTNVRTTYCDRTCIECGKVFSIQRWFVENRGTGRFCSYSCNGSAQSRVNHATAPSLRERYEACTDVRGPNECWLWTGHKDYRGYGYLKFRGRVRKATHIAWELANDRQFPAGMMACHQCDTPSCVNPSHIWAGTQKQNIQDCVAKKRQVNARKTHCPQGHPYTVVDARGFRRCSKCDRERTRARYRTNPEVRLRAINAERAKRNAPLLNSLAEVQRKRTSP